MVARSSVSARRSVCVLLALLLWAALLWPPLATGALVALHSHGVQLRIDALAHAIETAHSWNGTEPVPPAALPPDFRAPMLGIAVASAAREHAMHEARDHHFELPDAEAPAHKAVPTSADKLWCAGSVWCRDLVERAEGRGAASGCNASGSMAIGGGANDGYAANGGELAALPGLVVQADGAVDASMGLPASSASSSDASFGRGFQPSGNPSGSTPPYAGWQPSSQPSSQPAWPPDSESSEGVDAKELDDAARRAHRSGEHSSYEYFQPRAHRDKLYWQNITQTIEHSLQRLAAEQETAFEAVIGSQLGAIDMSIWVCFFIASVFLLCCIRQSVRERESRGKRGGLCCAALFDCCTAAFCFPCVLCQVARQQGLVGRHYRVFARDGGGVDMLEVAPHCAHQSVELGDGDGEATPMATPKDGCAVAAGNASVSGTLPAKLVHASAVPTHGEWRPTPNPTPKDAPRAEPIRRAWQELPESAAPPHGGVRRGGGDALAHMEEARDVLDEPECTYELSGTFFAHGAIEAGAAGVEVGVEVGAAHRPDEAAHVHRALYADLD